MLHYTLLLHVVDHASLIGTYNEISELSVGKRETGEDDDCPGERYEHMTYCDWLMNEVCWLLGKEGL
jgi:hypothetical protein